LAYRLRSTTVLRAGYGRSFNGAGVGAVFGQNPEVDPPVQFGQFLSAPNIYSPAVTNYLSTGPPLPPQFPIGSNGRFPLPDGVGVYFYFYPLDRYRIPLADFWNLSLQHEIRSDLTAEVAYVGNVGRHLFANRNTNQAVPGPGDFALRRPFTKVGLSEAVYAVSNYHTPSYYSLQAKSAKQTH